MLWSGCTVAITRALGILLHCSWIEPIQVNSQRDLLMYTRTNTPGLYFETALHKTVTHKIKPSWVTDQNLHVSKLYIVCAWLFTFSTVCHPLHISNKCPNKTLYSGTPSNTSHKHIHTHSYLWSKKKPASWSQWLVQSNRSPSPVSSLYSHTGDDTRCVHWRRGEDQGRGLRCPPERECWHIYWKGGDLTISKIREGADHRGGVAIPDWTNHPHSHIQEAEF